MYRIVRIIKGGAFDILTRSHHTRAGYKFPVYTANASDERIITYGTKHGALKRMAQLRRAGDDVVVVDASTGREIAESEAAR